MEKLLPVGTVVKVKKSEKLYLIASFFITTNSGEKYDYLAVRYPYGFIDDKCFFSFNKVDIDKVVHMGYESEIHNTCVAILDTLNKMNDN